MNDVQIPEAYGPGNHRPTAKKNAAPGSTEYCC